MPVLERTIAEAGYTPVERDTLYREVVRDEVTGKPVPHESADRALISA